MMDRMMGGGRTQAQTLAMLVAVTFVLVGVLGFIPGITTHYGDMSFAGDHSGAKLLGIFQVSILHNLVHLLFGVVGWYLAKTWSGARTYLLGGGVVYLALWILGILNGADWIPANSADNYLHLVLGVGLLGLGFLSTRAKTAPSPAIT
jgi:hypothetical protein